MTEHSALAATAPRDQAFAQDAADWARPELCESDIQQEIRILAATGLVANVTAVKPADTLWKK